MPFKKKWGAIRTKASQNRSLYDKAYYDIVKKPHRKNKDPIFLFQDVFSGMLVTKKQLQKPINQSKIVLREGCNYLNPFSLDKYKQKAEEEMEEYFDITTKRSLEYLNLAILRGYITKEEIAVFFDLKKIEKNKIININPTVFPASDVFSNQSEINKLANVNQLAKVI